MTESLVGLTAPPLAGEVWLNSPPLSLAALGQQHRVSLVYFWSYSSALCLPLLEVLSGWSRVYGPYGLTVIGVHTPRAPFEAEDTHLQRAVRDLGVTWPVLADVDRQTADSYHNRYWPRVLIVAPNGSVTYDQIGSGQYQALESALRSALHLAGARSLPDPVRRSEHVHRLGAVCYPTSPEYTEVNRVAQGTPFTLAFAGLSVRAVLAPEGETTGRVRVRLNGQPVPPEARGDDLVASHAETIVALDYPRCYHLVSSSRYLAPAELELTTLDDPFVLHSLTFGGCAVER